MALLCHPILELVGLGPARDQQISRLLRSHDLFAASPAVLSIPGPLCMYLVLWEHSETDRRLLLLWLVSSFKAPTVLYDIVCSSGQ